MGSVAMPVEGSVDVSKILSPRCFENSVATMFLKFCRPTSEENKNKSCNLEKKPKLFLFYFLKQKWNGTFATVFSFTNSCLLDLLFSKITLK
jgi:hypothetical protein